MHTFIGSASFLHWPIVVTCCLQFILYDVKATAKPTTLLSGFDESSNNKKENQLLKTDISSKSKLNSVRNSRFKPYQRYHTLIDLYNNKLRQSNAISTRDTLLNTTCTRDTLLNTTCAQDTLLNVTRARDLTFKLPHLSKLNESSKLRFISSTKPRSKRYVRGSKPFKRSQYDANMKNLNSRSEQSERNTQALSNEFSDCIGKATDPKRKNNLRSCCRKFEKECAGCKQACQAKGY